MVRASSNLTRSLLLAPTPLAERVDYFLICAMSAGLRVRQIKMSLAESMELMRARHVKHGYYRGVSIRLTGSPRWTS